MVYPLVVQVMTFTRPNPRVVSKPPLPDPGPGRRVLRAGFASGFASLIPDGGYILVKQGGEFLPRRIEGTRR